MKHVDFIITNPNHHVLITLPIARALQKNGVSVNYISLCEIRGFRTPEKILNDTHISFKKFDFDRSKKDEKDDNESKKASWWDKVKSAAMREVFWDIMIRPKFNKWFKNTTHAVLLNDTAYPGDFIIRYLSRKKITTILMQEGIRFPLPVEDRNMYGSSGVDYLIAWGQKSADYFKKMVKQKTQVLHLGSPGFDKSLYLQQSLDSVPDVISKIAIFGNPIDDQQFVSSKEKMAIYIDLARTLMDYSKRHKRDLEIVFKNHPREASEVLRDRLEKNGLGHIRVFESSSDIDIVLNTVDAGIVFASTVGINVILHGKKLAVVKLKNHDYLGDYVQDSVAYGLNMYSPEIDHQLDDFLGREHYHFRNYRRYLDHFASNSGRSDIVIAAFLKQL
ncbi:MAG: hypothetical protein COA58_01700 [Bacteroidetes bacterium]|nr:MAG: hypothetical protein COA58_01700 [Bacteroidota bacterium]